MIDHNTNDMSESEEMYLITIARLVEQGSKEPIPISMLAEKLSIQPVSANQMVHKLAEEELVEYLPYKGVELTPKGKQAASQVLRDRRLWEVFLVEHLKLSPGEADTLACRFEHITPKKLTFRLAEFLGYPAFSPQGLPIPDVDSENGGEDFIPLADLPIGCESEVMHLEGDPISRAFLNAEGIRPGAQVSLLALGGEGAMLIQVGDKRIHLARGAVENVMVRRNT
jgi:DtxR family Mn-dependent transcriptional regulator